MDGLQYRRKGIDLENTFVISCRSPGAEQWQLEQALKLALNKDFSAPGELLGNKASGAHILHLLYLKKEKKEQSSKLDLDA